MSSAIRPGTRIGKYEVLAHIATGGMGKVYKARDEHLGRVVALKVLSAQMAAKPAALERFRREARNAARLSHKHVVTLYECGEQDGTYFLALEYVQGIDLYEYIERKGQLQPEEARRILMQAVKAIDHAFAHGITHRDIKPSNFLLSPENGRLCVKLTDLGLAQAREDQEQYRVTRAGSTVGTIDYLAPEQARDSAAADVRSDIYSLGCTFYHMLAGQPPFAEGGLGERVYKHLQEEPADVRQFNPAVPEEMWAVLRKMLAKKPEDRYQTPAELLHDLKGLKCQAGPMQVVSAASLQPHHGDPPPSTDDPAGSSDDVPAAPVGRICNPSGWEDGLQIRPTEPAEEPALPPLSQTSEVRDDPALLGITPDQVQAAAAQFERAREAAARNNLDYAFDLLSRCCSLDPGSPAYRGKLREVGRLVAGRKARSGWLSGLTLRGRFKAARRGGDLRKLLEAGEELLLRNPDEIKVHLEMAEAAEERGLSRLALWLIEQARHQEPDNLEVLRMLARHYEKLKEYQQAIDTWEKVTKAAPHDGEAFRRMQNLAAFYTINRVRHRR
jgi:serine/threonine protein kinase